MFPIQLLPTLMNEAIKKFLAKQENFLYNYISKKQLLRTKLRKASIHRVSA